jgi:hypothetical protein
MSAAGDDRLVEVRLVGLPVDVHRAASEHSDEVTREFQLVALDPSTAPARLIALGDELRERFSAFTTGPSEALAAAVERGDSTIDLVYRVPESAADAARDLMTVLDEVDDYCEAGGMLTLATPPTGRLYRRWFLEAFIDQIGGAPPTPWAEFAGRAS